MIKAVIVDDESKARENLKFIIEDNFPNIEIVKLCGTIQEAVDTIEFEKPDLVFLDIMMKGESGFDLFDKLSNITFDVIFITAYDEYAMKALKLNAVDYLLKPIDVEDLSKAIEKVSNKKQKSSDKGKDLADLLNVLKPNKKINKIALPTQEGLYFVSVDDIIRCESDENYTLFYLKSGEKKLVSKTIKFFEDMLQSYNFFRCHRSSLVNLSYIKEYIRGDGGYIIMQDGSEVMVARRKKEEFMKLFSSDH